MINNLPCGNPLEIETLATRENSGQHLMHICCCQHKDSMRWWFLQCLEQSIKCLGSKHMRFVKHIDFILTSGRWHHHLLTQVANAINTTIGGSINLDDIERVACGNLAALLTLVARLTI